MSQHLPDNLTALCGPSLPSRPTPSGPLPVLQTGSEQVQHHSCMKSGPCLWLPPQCECSVALCLCLYFGPVQGLHPPPMVSLQATAQNHWPGSANKAHLCWTFFGKLISTPVFSGQETKVCGHEPPAKAGVHPSALHLSFQAPSPLVTSEVRNQELCTPNSTHSCPYASWLL